MTRYVLDSFALIAYFENEPGAAQVSAMLHGPHERWMTAVNLGEVYYLNARRHGRDVADDVFNDVLGMAIQLVEPRLPLTMDAARIKAAYPISYADCFAAALAQRTRALVVTGDPEFQRLERDGIVRVEWLPVRARR